MPPPAPDTSGKGGGGYGPLPPAIQTALRATAKISLTELTAEGMASANDPKLYPWVRISEILDEATCPLCEAVNGKVLPSDSELAKKWRQPSHTGCFPSGVEAVGPSVRRATSRWYDGELVEIFTASGNKLSATPNHPILTPQGWVAAGELVEGSYVVSSREPERVVASIYPDDYQIPSLIEDVFSSLNDLFGSITERVPVAAKDFHGDGEGSEVCVIRTNRLLGSRFNAALEQPFAQEEFGGGCAGLAGFVGSRHFASLFQSMFPAPRSLVGSFGEAAVFFGRTCRHHQAVGVGVGSERYVGEFEPQFDDVPANSKFIRQLANRLSGDVAFDDFGFGQIDLSSSGCCLAGVDFGKVGACVHRSLNLGCTQGGDFGEGSQNASGGQRGSQLKRVGIQPFGKRGVPFAGEVSVDRVVKFSRRQFAGHVYNLETSGGWYFANGIIAHNCRRVMSYISAEATATEVTFREPSEELIRKHGHYHLQPDKYAELRVPAQPGGRQFIARRVRSLDTGETKTVLDWATWWEQVPQWKRDLVLKARVTAEDKPLRGILELLGLPAIEDLNERLRQTVLLGLRDRLEGWITERVRGFYD